MKAFTIPALLASAAVSVVVVIPFLPVAKPDPRPFALEIRAASSVAGTARIYYDVGHGYRESDSTGLPVTQSDAPQLYRFLLPAGEYRSIRFDPIDGPGTVRLHEDLRIASQRGRLRHTIPLTKLEALEQIETLRMHDGRLEIVTGETAGDPQLAVLFSPPLQLRVALRDVIADLLPRAAVVFVALALLLLVLDRTHRWKVRVVATTRSLLRRPVRAVALAAAAAVVASAYPVVFLGRSHVSPNFGTTLLYEAFPTLPGYTSPEMSDGHGSDVGAAMWAHVPYAFMQRRAIANAEFPLWNRYSSTGTPLLAQAQSMLGDPLHIIVIAFNGAAWAWDLKYLIAKWLFATGLGLTVIAFLAPRASGPTLQEANGPPALPAALLVAFAAPFIGFFVYRINHPACFSLSYAPWLLLCWVRLADAAGRRRIALWTTGLLAANFSLFNSGTVKEAYLLLLQMNAAGACLVLSGSSPWRQRFARLGAAVFAGLLLVLVTAPVWQPFLQTLRHAYTAYSHPVAFQIQPSLLLGAFDEAFFRHLSEGDIVFNPALNVLFLLGVLYLVATLRLQMQNRGVLVLGLCAAVSLAFAFGVVPPHWIARVPFLANVAHIENCFLSGFIVFASVLAGVGFATAATRLGTREGRTDLILCGLMLVLVVGAWIGFRQASHRMVYGPGTTFTVVPANGVIPVSGFIWGYLLALLLASAVLALVAQRAFARRALGAGSAILGGLCLLVLLWRQGLHTSAMGFERFVVRPPVRAPFHGRSAAIDLVQTGNQREPSRVFGLHGNLTPGWNAAYDLETIHGPDALQNRWLRELIDASPVKWSSSWRLYCSSGDGVRARPFLDALNVRYYLDGANSRAEVGPELTLVGTADLNVYESSTVWPRAFFTDRVDSYETPAGLMKTMLVAGQPPFAAIQQADFVTQPGVSRLSREIATRTVNAATNYTLTANATSFRVRAGGPGLVVLTEAWWPDSFRVEVDGERRPLVRVNHAFKGVVIESAGEHAVTFYYWPRNFLRVLLLAGGGAVLLIIALVLALRPARPA